LAALLTADQRITRWVDGATLPTLLDASAHVGDAPARAHQLAAAIRAAIASIHES
jgi:hypothetical protein